MFTLGKISQRTKGPPIPLWVEAIDCQTPGNRYLDCLGGQDFNLASSPTMAITLRQRHRNTHDIIPPIRRP